MGTFSDDCEPNQHDEDTAEIRDKHSADHYAYPDAIGGALAANLYPYSPGGATSFLVALHLPLLLWLAFCLAYAADGWRTTRVPLDFIRFSGELFIYGVLLLAGGVVLVVVAFFSAIGVPIADFAQEYLSPLPL